MKKLIRHFFRTIKENVLAEQGRWFAWVPFLFGMGIALYFSLPFEPNLWLISGVVEVWLLLFYLCRFKNLNMLFIGGLIIICGFVNIQMHTIYQAQKVQFAPQRVTYLSGQITDITASEKGQQRLMLNHAADWDNPLIGQYRITNTGAQEDFNVGECVEMIGTIFPPSRVPLLNGFQLDRKYFYESISGIGYANSEIFKIKCPRGADKLSFTARLNNLRRKIGLQISTILPPSTAGIAEALIIGEKSNISPQITDNYRGAGLAHFLAVSGLHLGCIAGLIFFLVRWILALFPSIALRYDSKKPAAVAAILFSALYLLMSGMAVPAERAFIMTVVVLIGVLFDRQAISMRMVSFAALVILISMPQALISVSFQMSFAAVYALVAFYERFAGFMASQKQQISWFGRIMHYLIGIVVADFVASLATAPMAMYHFQQLAIYTSLGNLLAGPLIGLYLMPMILVCLATLPFNAAALPLKALGWGLETLNNITAEVSALPNSLLTVPDMPLWGFLLIVCGAYWLCAWQKKWRLWGLAPIVAGLLSILTAQNPVALVAPNGTGFAVQNQENMVLVPLPTDSWLKKVWQERWQVRTLHKKDFKKSADGCLQLPETVMLSCQKGIYRYRGKVIFEPQKELKIDGQTIDWRAGGYIYENADKLEFVPLWNAEHCRRWQTDYQKCSVLKTKAAR